MKKDISTVEIRTIIVISHLLDDYAAIISKKGISKDEHKYLSCIKTYSFKYLKSVMDRIDQKSAKRVQSKILNYLPKLEPVNRYGNERVVLSSDDYYDLVEQVLDSRCKGCDGEKEECSIRRVLNDTFVPALECSKDHICEYMFKVEDLQES